MLERLTRLLSLACISVVLCIAAGCGGRTAQSSANLEALARRLRDFQYQHGKLPDAIDQLEESFAGEDEYARTMRNPLTGDDPGYAYVKPPAGVLGSSLARRVVVLYQLRGGERADDLAVGFASGDSGPLQPDSIVSTVPAWSRFASPAARMSVMLPSEPAADARDPAKIGYTVSFCGVQYTVLASQSPMYRMLAQSDPQVLLQMLRDEVGSKLGGRQGASSAIELDGRPGLTVEYEVPDSDNELRVRWYVSGERLYCLSVAGPIGSLNEENAGVFFDSFKFLAD